MSDPKRQRRAETLRTVVIWIVVLLGAVLLIPALIILYADLRGGV